jgi:hypothetical protein
MHYDLPSVDNAMTSTPDITFVLTSCGRFDLLVETISSFLAFNTAPIARYVIVEDSGDASVRDILASFDARFELLLNEERRGQIESIDRGYSSVSTPYIFHCEDDWRFFRSGFVEESLLLLENFANISAVLCRRARQNAVHDRFTRSMGVSRLGGVEFRQPALGVDESWGGYSFNPGLRRLADYRRIGSFAACGHEDGGQPVLQTAGNGRRQPRATRVRNDRPQAPCARLVRARELEQTDRQPAPRQSAGSGFAQCAVPLRVGTTIQALPRRRGLITQGACPRSGRLASRASNAFSLVARPLVPSLQPRTQFRLVAFDRLIVQVEDARVAPAPAAVVHRRARRRDRPRIFVRRVRHGKSQPARIRMEDRSAQSSHSAGHRRSGLPYPVSSR